jgi:hypothetical protein
MNKEISFFYDTYIYIILNKSTNKYHLTNKKKGCSLRNINRTKNKQENMIVKEIHRSICLEKKN